MAVQSGERAGSSRRGAKSKEAFRTISEVASELDVAQHVLRFWETKFHQIRPLKRGGGRRYYRPEDIELLRQIKRLLYTEGYTIKGVQRLMRHGGVAALQNEHAEGAVAASADEASGDKAVSGLSSTDKNAIRSAIADLEACRRLLATRG